MCKVVPKELIKVLVLLANKRHSNKNNGIVDIPRWLRLENGWAVCDMLLGPCACGAWHKLNDTRYCLELK